MKKLLTLLVSILILLPIVVSADMVKPKVYYNHQTVVGGYIEESLVFPNEGIKKSNDFVIQFDTNYLSITEKDVKVINYGKNILDDSNNGTVKVEDGKVIINITNIPEERPGIDWDLGVESTAFYIRANFKAIKAGETKISTSQQLAYYPTIAKVTIEENNCPETKPSESVTNCVPSNQTVDDEPKEEPKEDIAEEPNIIEPVEYDNCDDEAAVSFIFFILLIISGFFNLVLLILLIVLLIVKRKPKQN